MLTISEYPTHTYINVVNDGGECTAFFVATDAEVKFVFTTKGGIVSFSKEDIALINKVVNGH